MKPELTEDPISVSIPALKVRQPVGEFFVSVLGSRLLCEITEFDVRRILKERDFEKYLGIQRPLNMKRVDEIEKYLTTVDACFPTAVVLSVDGSCAEYNEQTGQLTLSNYIDPQYPERTRFYRQIAKVIDGQHRIEALKAFRGQEFDVNVCIFVDIDVAEEGYIFSTVNLTQTKVNKSLAYDLYDLAKSRSPQKLCHNVAVVLDQTKNSPFYHRIKRLGVATEGRFDEMLTQATIVEALMPYISKEPTIDRDLYIRNKTPHKVGILESQSLIFRNMMIDEQDMAIADVLWNYFDAVRQKWPRAWDAKGRGQILNKTNGFRDLMRFLRDAYVQVTRPGLVPKTEDFTETIFHRIDLHDDYFNTENFKPGTSGEVALYHMLRMKSGM